MNDRRPKPRRKQFTLSMHSYRVNLSSCLLSLWAFIDHLFQSYCLFSSHVILANPLPRKGFSQAEGAGRWTLIKTFWVFWPRERGELWEMRRVNEMERERSEGEKREGSGGKGREGTDPCLSNECALLVCLRLNLH